MRRIQLFDQPEVIPVFEDYEHLEDKCIGLTGQRGVLGEILQERLVSHGIHIETYPGDITDVRGIGAWFKEHQFAHFFHFAAVVPVGRVKPDPCEMFETNAIGSYNICKEIITTQQNCWLFLASSSHVYKPTRVGSGERLTVGSAEAPNSVYGASKLTGEQISRSILEICDVEYCIGRIFSFSNIRQKEPFLVPTLKRKMADLADNCALELTNPDSVRDIMDGESVIDCILHLSRGRIKGTLNIGSGKGMSVRDIALHLANMMRKTITIRGKNKGEPDALVADISDLRRILLKSV